MVQISDNLLQVLVLTRIFSFQSVCKTEPSVASCASISFRIIYVNPSSNKEHFNLFYFTSYLVTDFLPTLFQA
jgi:hypothetical protein